MTLSWRKTLQTIITFFIFIPVSVLMLLATLLLPKKRNTLIWGPIPLLNNKYWSAAMKQAGYESQTLMKEYYNIHQRNDFDLYYEDLLPFWLLKLPFSGFLKRFSAFCYVISHASVFHMSFNSGIFGDTAFWKVEGFLLRLAGIKTVVIPYGADAYLYSRIMDTSTRNALLLTKTARMAMLEEKLQQKVSYWVKHADIVIAGIMLDGIGRWDVTIGQFIQIDTHEWHPRQSYSKYNGLNGPVRIIHTPNHRHFKGTEFLLQAVQQIQAEGWLVELILLEKVPNQEVRQRMQAADILAEQFIFPGGYALSGIEGMACGLPVLANLSHESYTRVFRRYSFLNECPVLSTTPETLKQNLLLLICNPDLRETLGRAGRAYVEKYHSYETARYLFGSIYRKLLQNEDIDLMNLFHPLTSEYNKRAPYVKHPLIENQLPPQAPEWDKLKTLKGE